MVVVVLDYSSQSGGHCGTYHSVVQVVVELVVAMVAVEMVVLLIVV